MEKGCLLAGPPSRPLRGTTCHSGVRSVQQRTTLRPQEMTGGAKNSRHRVTLRRPPRQGTARPHVPARPAANEPPRAGARQAPRDARRRLPVCVLTVPGCPRVPAESILPTWPGSRCRLRASGRRCVLRRLPWRWPPPRALHVTRRVWFLLPTVHSGLGPTLPARPAPGGPRPSSDLPHRRSSGTAC